MRKEWYFRVALRKCHDKVQTSPLVVSDWSRLSLTSHRYDPSHLLLFFMIFDVTSNSNDLDHLVH